MALRYSAEFLLHLRESPLCTRPDNLPPVEDWMGATPEQLRAQPVKTTTDRTQRTTDNPLVDQSNRRQGVERHVSRNSANPEDIVFGPPRMAFSSARGNKSIDDKTFGQLDGRTGLRNRSGDLDVDRLRDGRSANLRRNDADQDSDGWSTVKPRKSFGAEGAERFHGKMGGNYRDEKRPPRDRDDREPTRDRPTRAFDSFVREREATPETEPRPRNGAGRSKLDTWRSGNDTKESAPTPEKRERDRTKSWRDRDRDTEPAEEQRGGGRNTDRRWGRDRDQRVERDPEWLDEPQPEQREAHTQQDFQKWMEQMKAAKSGASAAAAAATKPNPAVSETVEVAKPAAPSPAVEAGPDKFFMAFGGGSSASLPVASPPEQIEVAPAAKAKPAGKSSRFTSFFAQPQPDGRTRQGHPSAPDDERQAFQQLLAKLQKQSMSATPPGASPFPLPQQGNHLDQSKKSAITSPEPFQQYGGDRRDGPMGRPPSQQPREILAPRPQPQTARPDQLLNELVGHHNRVSSQGSGRADPGAARNNSNTEFLMNLMRPGLATQQSDHQVRMQQQQQQQPQKPAQMTPYSEREMEFPGVENRNSQRQGRNQPPPGFPMDDSFHGADQEQRQNQPPQILQRPPPPPGLNQMPPEWMTRGQMPPPQQRGPMGPPPGLAGEPNRNMPVPHMFPPNFPPGAMPPPPEALGGMPPRNMPMPPPGFFAGPPPQGFLPPGLGAFNGPPGPESHGFGGSPFEGRGMPPAGNRGTSYGRP
ncbi:kinase-like domain-containing protein [Purpureocillium lavendulum]|uniref:Kinase-like domain-containing protein n=1 Tax=Purpureocillium lavendulum TaxID=1247861 RepID=A0AB34G099_9HYPO|nr:kinase-like domain-containing protein [Purpureocillium lavendulum]